MVLASLGSSCAESRVTVSGSAVAEYGETQTSESNFNNKIHYCVRIFIVIALVLLSTLQCYNVRVHVVKMRQESV